jgi:site-specific DNA-cytosine methylase
VSPTLNAFDNTGDKRSIVLIVQETTHDVIGTLQAGCYKGVNHENARDGHLIIMKKEPAILILDGTRVDDVRVYEEPVQTLKERMGTGGNNVPIMAIPIQGTIIGRQDHNGPQGKGFGDEGDPSYTLDSISQHGVATDMQVRRLTPLECERLMGWPDNHTLPRADGKQNSDTTRYKMCGNGVATPVAKWIGEKIVGIQQSTPRL